MSVCLCMYVYVFMCVFSVLLEQFIRAKYEREEFVEPGRQLGYIASTKSGHLFKRHRDSAKFEIRRFELNEASNTLSYYVKEVRPIYRRRAHTRANVLLYTTDQISIMAELTSHRYYVT